MRIRSVHPSFWTSDDVTSLDWDTRLVFIGLWSYVDDNGVGRDVDKLIVAELFPLEDDARDTLARVQRALATLSNRGLITRYTVDERPLLYVTGFPKWQRVDRPGKTRYSPPTCENAVIRDTLATPSRRTRDVPATGEGEKGRRGEGENYSRSPGATTPPRQTRPPGPSAPADGEFETWWSTYPRKVGKGRARTAYKAARKKTDPDTLLLAAKRQTPELTRKGAEFCPHPATWLNAERWTDDDRPTQALPPYDGGPWRS